MPDDDIVDAEIVEGHFKQVELTPAEADLMGEATMHLIEAGLDLRQFITLDNSDMPKLEGPEEELLSAMKLVANWAGILLDNIQQQTAKAGLGFLP